MSLQEQLLRALPVVRDDEDEQIAAKTGIAFGDLREFLRQRNHSLPCDRTIRRALLSMSGLVGCVGKTRGTRWFKTDATKMLPSDERMSANLAVALSALERVAHRQLPFAVFSELEPKFKEAAATLSFDINNPVVKHGRTWASKIARIDGTQPVIFPPIDDAVYRTVTDALLRDRKLSFRYRRATSVAQYDMSPQALVDRAGVFYVVMWASTRPKTRYLFRLDRMLEALTIEEPAEHDSAFDLHTYINSEKAFNFFPEPDVELRLRVHSVSGAKPRAASEHMLNEFRLHDDQRIVYAPDRQSFELTAIVKPSVMLRQFLHSHADSIEV
ncbi:WYL domain-containing protein, partial [Paraburkholderia sp. J67]|uniref:helix-turn-helix transcriptional regulator n=1 Tax=Paraburkholderia sp. J67 TaxID=2805435 RepID=UPI002ABDE80C